MSRTLGTGLPALLSAAVTQPGYLVEIDFTPPVYLSSRGAVSWASKSWESYDIRLSGFGIDGASSDQAGSINVGNADNVIGALCLVQGVAEREVYVWKLYTDTPAADEPLLIFAGVCDSYAVNSQNGSVSIRFEQQSARTQYTPRRYITRLNGFSALVPAGTMIPWNNEVIRLGVR